MYLSHLIDNLLPRSWIILLLLQSFALSAQWDFLASEDLLLDNDFRSVDPIAITDLNNDQLDDIVIAHRGVAIHVAIQEKEGFDIRHIGNVGNFSQWACVVFDVDRNGWRDIIFSGVHDGIKIFYQNDGEFTMTIEKSNSIYARYVSRRSQQ